MNKFARLKAILVSLKNAVVAYSGGLDSTLLLKVAVDTLGKGNVLAVTARSETYPASEYACAKDMARRIGARFMTIHTSELAIPRFKQNPADRCYYCKRELFKKLDEIRKRNKFHYLLDGTNYDDLKDVRHGRKAAAQRGVRSPLLEAKITKTDIRAYSKRLKLPTWDKPSFACLASRIPFGDTIERKALTTIDKAENYVRELGVRQVRVRAHKRIARIEVAQSDFAKIISRKDQIVKRLRALGFVYVALDLAGYRTGSMHEAA